MIPSVSELKEVEVVSDRIITVDYDEWLTHFEQFQDDLCLALR